MISKPNDKFWTSVLDECVLHASEGVVHATGPALLTLVYSNTNKELINVLPKEIYNPSEDTVTNNKMKARQMMTASWVGSIN